MRDETQNAALSGAASGGILGLVGSGLAGGGLKSALRASLLGALTGGAISGAGVGTGTAMLGSPEEDEVNPYTRRGVLGGGVAGAGMGGLLGAALAKRFLKFKAPPPALKALADQPVRKAAGIGAGAGGAFGAYQAGDEGMQVDFIKNEIDELQRKRKAEMLGRQLMEGGFA